jgi:hypothetical protein
MPLLVRSSTQTGDPDRSCALHLHMNTCNSLPPSRSYATCGRTAHEATTLFYPDQPDGHVQDPTQKAIQSSWLATGNGPGETLASSTGSAAVQARALVYRKDCAGERRRPTFVWCPDPSARTWGRAIVSYLCWARLRTDCLLVCAGAERTCGVGGAVPEQDAGKYWLEKNLYNLIIMNVFGLL